MFVVFEKLILMDDAQKRYRATTNGRQKYRENMREYMIVWRKKPKESEDYDIEEERRKWREQHRKVGEKAMDCLGGQICVNCGCDDFLLLEINHINGGRRTASKTRSNRQLYRNISAGRVNLEEYNVLCRVCNALHYVEEILGIKGHQVLWRDSIIG